jgi:hypothetical protein
MTTGEIPPMSTEQELRIAGRHEDANRLMYSDLSPMWFSRMRHFKRWSRDVQL